MLNRIMSEQQYTLEEKVAIVTNEMTGRFNLEDVLKALDRLEEQVLFEGQDGVMIKNAEDILEQYMYYSGMIVKNPHETKTLTLPFNKRERVYFLLQGNYVCYVGQTMHLIDRVSQHVNDKDFDFVSYIDVAPREMMLIEAFNISYHNPEYNTVKDTKTALLRKVAKTIVYD